MGLDDVTSAPRASVVIPAHNEERGIGRCLAALAATPAGASAEIVVAANGCTDRTVAAARAFADRLPRLTVLDLARPSKAAALNAGDRAATAFPRIYLDADIVLDAPAVAGLVTALTGDVARVASPRIRFDSAAASWPVRRFYDAYARTPYIRTGLVGLGVYGVSAAGRARFADFPDLIADDLFVQRLFAPSERLTSAGTFTVETPRTLASLVKVRTRTAQGSAQLDRAPVDVAPDAATDTSRTTSDTLRALLRQARQDPHLAPSVAVYTAVTVAARLRARGAADTAWFRDDSTRAPSPTAGSAAPGGDGSGR